MSLTLQMATSDLVFRKTNVFRGRHLAVTPKNSPMKHLNYGRIILDSKAPDISFKTGEKEVGLICLSGKATASVRDQSHELERYDSIYIPRDSTVRLSTGGGVDFVECSAKVEGKYPVQVVHYSDVKQDASLRFVTGGPGSSRTLRILIGKNVEAGRILAGATTSEPGNWTSWPPHEHASMLEELYVFYDMPAPAFGVQFVYTNPDEPELISVVRDGDAVLMPGGYHPNVAVPGHRINFVWMMAADREVEDRQFGVVNIQPGFDTSGSGLEASRE